MQSLLSELCWNLSWYSKSLRVSFPPPSCLCLLVSPCFIIKQLLFPLKIILLGDIVGKSLWCNTCKSACIVYGLTKGTMLSMCGCVSRGSFSKEAEGQTAVELTFAVLSSHVNQLNPNLIFTSTHLVRMVCISTVVQGTTFCSGKTKRLI